MRTLRVTEFMTLDGVDARPLEPVAHLTEVFCLFVSR